MYKKCIAIRLKVQGADHPDIATNYNNLAGLYQQNVSVKRGIFLGQTGRDKPIFVVHDTALSWRVCTAVILTFVAMVPWQGNYEEAEKLYRQAISIGEKTLGKEHPDVAVWYSNLGLLLKTNVSVENVSF